MNIFKRTELITFSILFMTAICIAAPDFSKCIGFASIDGSGKQKLVGGVTGGKGGPAVIVKNADDLIKYAKQDGPLTIYIEGTIVMPTSEKKSSGASLFNTEFVSSNKSIIGKGKDATIKAGAFAIGNWDEAKGFVNEITSPPDSTVHNVIIQNITFDVTGGKYDETDAISIFMHAHHIWIDHCTFKNIADGAVDIKRGANYCTFSYCHFIKTDKTCLCGHDDKNKAQDDGYLKTTYHHNYFEETKQRGPRVRFGEVHVFNNYYKKVTSYALGTGTDCKIYSEKNIMEDSKAFTDDFKGGVYEDFGSSLINSKVGDGKKGPVGWQPKDYYSYTADDTETAKKLAIEHAGAGKVDFKVGVYNQGLKLTKNLGSTSKMQAISLLGVKLASQKQGTPDNAAGLYIIQKDNNTVMSIQKLTK